LIAVDDRAKWFCKPKDATDLAQKIKAYMAMHWKQELTTPIDIDTLIGRYCEQIGVGA